MGPAAERNPASCTGGVALWEGPDERRIFLNTRWRLIAIDAETGEPIETFGHKGEIDLTEKLLWPTNRLHYTQTSPPVVFEDLLIIGNGVWDGFVYPRDPPGNIQAFDVRTGDLVWSFNLIPQPGEPGNETWEDGSWDYTGHTNAWAPMVVDEERGLLFAGIGTPSNDYYGGHRIGDNLYAESLVALDARTGTRQWHYQTVRHGLWDFDPSRRARSHDVERGRPDRGRRWPWRGKTGFVYTFERETRRARVAYRGASGSRPATSLASEPPPPSPSRRVRPRSQPKASPPTT